MLTNKNKNDIMKQIVKNKKVIDKEKKDDIIQEKVKKTRKE